MSSTKRGPTGNSAGVLASTITQAEKSSSPHYGETYLLFGFNSIKLTTAWLGVESMRNYSAVPITAAITDCAGVAVSRETRRNYARVS